MPGDHDLLHLVLVNGSRVASGCFHGRVITRPTTWAWYVELALKASVLDAQQRNPAPAGMCKFVQRRRIRPYADGAASGPSRMSNPDPATVRVAADHLVAQTVQPSMPSRMRPPLFFSRIR